MEELELKLKLNLHLRTGHIGGRCEEASRKLGVGWKNGRSNWLGEGGRSRKGRERSRGAEEVMMAG